MISVIKYCHGFLKNLFNPGVSLFSIVDKSSSISPKARIYRGVKVYDSNIEAYTYVTPKTEINWANIGKFCSISSYCCIGLGMHAIQNISTSPIFISMKNSTGYQWTQCNTFVESQRIFIGNDVWIGARVMVKCGIKIGNGAIIGAGSIVTKDIPDYAIAVGVPARVIRYRFDSDIINRLNEIKWWDLPELKLKENIDLFQKEDIALSDLERIVF